MTPGLPWPWRACKGGRVVDARGETVTTCADRRQARRLIRDVEPMLRALECMMTSTMGSPISHEMEPTYGATYEYVINGQSFTVAADATAEEFASVLNASSAFHAIAEASVADGHVTLTFKG